MKTVIIAAAFFAGLTSVAPAAPITTTLHVSQLGATTNPLVYDGEYDVYTVVAHNPNPTPVTALEIDLTGDFLQVGGADFWTPNAIFHGLIHGFETPDSYFYLPVEIAHGPVFAADVIDSPTRLAAKYAFPGARDLVPANGSAPIVVISVRRGVPVTLPPVLGRADIGGRFASVVHVPEPSATVLGGLALVGSAARRRCIRRPC